jgi:hypothetical protein
MTTAGHVELTKRNLDAIAWRFLGSEFTGQIYANWPIDRRLDAYLRHHELIDIVNDGPPTTRYWNASWPTSVAHAAMAYSRRRVDRHDRGSEGNGAVNSGDSNHGAQLGQEVRHPCRADR